MQLPLASQTHHRRLKIRKNQRLIRWSPLVLETTEAVSESPTTNTPLRLNEEHAAQQAPTLRLAQRHGTLK